MSNHNPGLSLETVEHIAKLCRLKLTLEEKEQYSKDLSKMLKTFEALNQAEITVKASHQEVQTYNEQTSKLRQDKAQNLISTQDFIKQVPTREGVFVRVPSILVEE